MILCLVKRKDGGESWMPLDLKPNMAGQIAATKDVHGVLHGRILTGDEGTKPGETRYITHFGTCPKYRKPAAPAPKPAPNPAQTLF